MPCCWPVTPASARPGCCASSSHRAGDGRLAHAGRALPRLRRQRPALPAVLRAVRPARRRRRPRSPTTADRAPPCALAPAARPPAALRRRRRAPRDSLDRAELFEAVHGALDDLAERARRCSSSIEDVHWADRSTRDLLTFLFARAFRGAGRRARRPTAPTTCTAATRCAPPSPSGSGSRASQRVQLDPLADDDVRRLVRALLPGAAVRGATCAAIVRRAEGNAFFAEELVSARPGRARRRACPTTSPTCCWCGSTGSTTTPATWSGPPPAPAAGSPTPCSPPSSATPDDELDARAARRRRAERPGPGRRRQLRLPARPARRGGLRRPAARRAGRLHAAYAEALRSAASTAPPPSSPGTPGWRTTRPPPSRASVEAGDEAMAVGGPDEAARALRDRARAASPTRGSRPTLDQVDLALKAARRAGRLRPPRAGRPAGPRPSSPTCRRRRRPTTGRGCSMSLADRDDDARQRRRPARR